MAYLALTPLEQILWHLSVAIHHLQAALDHQGAHEVLTPDEYRTLEHLGQTIADQMDRLVEADDGGTDAP